MFQNLMSWYSKTDSLGILALWIQLPLVLNSNPFSTRARHSGKASYNKIQKSLICAIFELHAMVGSPTRTVDFLPIPH